MIRIAICDDDRAFTGYLDNLLSDYFASSDQKHEVSVFLRGDHFCRHLATSGETFDIVFMDIEMPELNGVEAGRQLRESIAGEMTLLIYVSAHQTYYPDIVNLEVFCFIKKPVHPNELRLHLNRAVGRVHRLRQLPAVTGFPVRIQKRDILIPIGSILYFESDQRKVHLHTLDEIYQYYSSLDAEIAKLPMRGFARTHQSYIINLAHAVDISATRITLSNGTTFNISRSYRESTKKAYMLYLEV